MKLFLIIAIILISEAFTGFVVLKLTNTCIFEDYSVGQCYSDIPQPWDAGIHNLF